MNSTVYTLINKETPLCDFIIEGEGELELCKIIKEYNTLPFWCEPISSWVDNRSSAKHRTHVNKILEMCGGKTKSGFIALTHCLSLTDTLWVKSNKEDVNWKQINLYENKFDEVVSKLSFDGNGLFGIQMSTTSPELTTDGAYDKCWLNKDDGIHLIKTGSDGARNTGLEPYGEVLASQVFEKMCNSVKYSLIKYDGRVVSDCKLFTDEHFGYKPISLFLKNGIKYGLPETLELYREFKSEDAFRRMIVADCITLNCDRHFGNFGFLVNNETFERSILNPCFDFNMAFVPFAEEGFDFGTAPDGTELDFDEYLSTRGPVIGSNYVAPARAILTPDIKKCVEEIRETKLTVPCDDKFTEKRLAQMNMIKNVQCERILGFEAKWEF
ncbi:MAG: hypothetical protein IJ688_10010 [Treponema sp.]|uniref:hypothetical protein n=1 Tax=Treponema sp. TaxID=166 RepID=UPI0025CEEFCA|nr:hypothetical protein [Treponema sp.]MBQ8680494.1 hypothetical protein [Treponema sp.]MBR1639705.1 hypothetical protein [Treponema sp.]